MMKQARPGRLLRGVAALAIVAMPLAPAEAETWMDDFYSGVTTSTTSAGVFRTQTANIYSGGGFMVRVPNRNYQIAMVTPPTLKGGCGGIDAWLGSFGFINKEQFVQLLRNIGQAAVGALFMTAVESLSPELAGVLKYLQDQAAKINALTANSCGVGQALAGSLTNDWMRDRSAEAANIRRELNDSTDAFLGALRANQSLDSAMDAWSAAGVQSRRGHVDSSGNPVNQTEMNITWAALKRAPGQLSNEERELAMSLLGAVVLTASDNTEGEGSVSTDTATQDKVIALRGGAESIRPQDLIGSADGATSMKILKCDDDVACMNPSPQTVTANGFARIANVRMTRILQRLRDRQGQDTGDLKLLNVTTVPVYRLLSTAAQADDSGVIGQQIVSYYTDVVAADLLDHFVGFLGDEVAKALKNHARDTHKPIADELDKLGLRMREVRQEAAALRQTAHRAAQQRAALITELTHLQAHAVDSLGVGLAANLRFGSR